MTTTDPKLAVATTRGRARTRVRYRPAVDLDATEVQHVTGSTVVTVGRVARFGTAWAGLAVGARAWGPYRPTRAAATADVHARRTYLDTDARAAS